MKTLPSHQNLTFIITSHSVRLINFCTFLISQHTRPRNLIVVILQRSVTHNYIQSPQFKLLGRVPWVSFGKNKKQNNNNKTHPTPTPTLFNRTSHPKNLTMQCTQETGVHKWTENSHEPVINIGKPTNKSHGRADKPNQTKETRVWTWWTYMYLPFGVLFCGFSEMDSKLHKSNVLWTPSRGDGRETGQSFIVEAISDDKTVEVDIRPEINKIYANG